MLLGNANVIAGRYVGKNLLVEQKVVVACQIVVERKAHHGRVDGILLADM